MKTTSKLILGVIGIVAIGAITYRAVNTTPPETLAPNERVLAILEDGGCAECHVAEPKLPFYANFPIAKTMITEDIVEGYKAFDIEPVMKAIQDNQPINEVDLAKMEKTILDGSMPLAKYYLVHWGSSLTDSKTEILLEWIKNHRIQFYPNPLASAEFSNETIRPIPDAVEYDSAKAELGKLLYHDTRLSDDGTISCATCHGINTGGVDNLQYSEGIKGQFGGVNAPTVYNAVFNFVQFWDGRAATLADQAAGPPLNPVEMGCKTFDEIADRLKEDQEFSKAFCAIYPEGLNQHTITDAIAEYEKTLVTPNSAFDRYLKGDKDALTAEQIKGYELFKKYDCATCHAGINMGGLTYELMGQQANYFQDREKFKKSGLTDGDNGRWAQTGIERDRYRFKTPTLRNVELTYPYYHDGSVETLEEAVRMMATYEVGVNLTNEEINTITAYLKTLTGQYNGKTLTNENTK